MSFLLWSIWKMRDAIIFQQEFFQPTKCLIRAKKLSAEWRIRTCMSIDKFIQGLPSPLHTKFKLLGGIHLHQKRSNSISMDQYYKAIQQYPWLERRNSGGGSFKLRQHFGYHGRKLSTSGWAAGGTKIWLSQPGNWRWQLYCNWCFKEWDRSVAAH